MEISSIGLWAGSMGYIKRIIVGGTEIWSDSVCKVEIKNECGDGALDMTKLDSGGDSVSSGEIVTYDRAIEFFQKGGKIVECDGLGAGDAEVEGVNKEEKIIKVNIVGFLVKLQINGVSQKPVNVHMEDGEVGENAKLEERVKDDSESSIGNNKFVELDAKLHKVNVELTDDEMESPTVLMDNLRNVLNLEDSEAQLAHEAIQQVTEALLFKKCFIFLHHEVEHDANVWEGYVDYRFRRAQRGRHGGMRAALFVLAVEVLENLAFLANASNLVLYMRKYMNLSPTRSAINVTNFMGTSFLLALLGGFLSDAFYTSYHIYLMSACVEFLGLVILTFQARSPYLKPAPCDKPNTALCEHVHGGKAAMLFIGLYLVAFGVGGIKGSLPSLGAEQFDENTPKGRKQRSTFFNYFVFCLSFGGLIAVTLVLWIEDNVGWQWGFGISTIAIVLSIMILVSGSWFYRCKVPNGSPLATMFKVLLASTLSTSKTKNNLNDVITNMTQSPYPLIPTFNEEQQMQEYEQNKPTLSNSLRFLNRAAENKPSHKSLECSVQEVEDVKIMIHILPIFACTIILNCCLAQLSTFSVHQASTMNTMLGTFKVPPGSLPVFPITFMMIMVPLYDHVIIPYLRKWTKSETGVSHLKRAGIGLCFSILAMVVAALVETKRKKVANEHGLDNGKLSISFLWIAFQYLFLGSADLFVLAGLMEFAFSEAPIRMRSLATSFSWASLALGYYLSGVIVSLVNSVTGSGKHHHPWLAGENLNHYRLDRFYWLMSGLSVLNLVNYVFWANRYKYKSISANN